MSRAAISQAFARRAFRRRRDACFLVAAMLLAAVLGLTGLGNQKFWDDEANTALYGRNLLRFGRLTAFDGTNLVGYAYGGALGEDLGRELRVPGLPACLAAAGLWLWGETTWAARAPFVLCGVLAVGLLAVWTRRLLGHRFPCWLPALLMAVSPAFLLYVRNCRYYAPGLLFTLLVWTIWTPAGPLPRHGNGSAVSRAGWLRCAAGALAMLLLLNTHYLNAATALATLPVFFLIGRFRQPRQYVLLAVFCTTAAVYGVWVLATANPFATEYLYVADWLLPVSASPSSWVRVAVHLGWLLRDLGTHEFFAWLLVPVLLLPWLWRAVRRMRPVAVRAWVLVSMLTGYVAVAAVLTPADMAKGPAAEMRYVVPLVVVGAVVAAAAVSVVAARLPSVAAALLLLLVTTNLLHLGFLARRFDETNPCWPPTLYRYVAELFNDYTTGNEAMIALLRRLPDGTTVRTWPTYRAHAAMFYVPGLHYCDQLTEQKTVREDLKPRLPDYLFVERARPDVVVVPAPYAGTALARFESRFGRDSYVLRKVLAPHYNYTSKPELPLHFFAAAAPDMTRFPGLAVLVAADGAVADHAALATKPHDRDGLLRLARTLLAAGRNQAAESRLEQLLRLDPQSARAHFYLGVLREKRREWQQAIEHYEAAIRHDPNDVLSRIKLGNALQALGRTAAARRQYDAALLLDPGCVAAHYNLGNLALARADGLDEAIAHYRAALRADTGHAFSHVNLGIALARQQQPDEAIEHYRAALRIDPDLVEAHVRLALALAERGERRTAIEELHRALALLPPESQRARLVRQLMQQLSDTVPDQ